MVSWRAIHIRGRMSFLRRIINAGTSTQQEMLQRLAILRRLLSRAENMEFRRPKVHSLLTLGLRTGQDDDMAPHCCGQFYGNMAQSANTHDSHSVSGLDAIFSQDSPDCGTSTHKRCGVDRVISLGNGEDAVDVPDGAVAESTVVEIVETVLFLVAAVLVPAYFVSQYSA